jgi:serine protease Do
MNPKQLMLGLTASAFVGGAAALGGYKLLEPAQMAAPTSAQYPVVRYTSEMRSAVAPQPEGLNFTKAAETVTPAVVHITSEISASPTANRGGSPLEMDPFFRQFFGDMQPRGNQRGVPQVGTGSGVVIASNGYIVTNNHVIDNADKIEVVLDDKRKYTAKLVGTDPNTDIALLKIDATGLPAVRYANSDQVRVGEWVLAVGNPFNLNSTVTAGIISAKGRNINIMRRTNDKGQNMGIESFLQTDAVVNPGNSGGALVNLNGDLIGINTAIATQTGVFEGYSFAVPSSIVSKVVDDLMKYGTVQRALLGVNIQEVDAALKEEKKLNTLNGVYIAGLSKESAAADAGLKEGDVITNINDVPVNTQAQLQEQVARFRPGDKIKVSYLRGASAETTTATLRNTSGTTSVVKVEDAKTVEVHGATFKPLTSQEMTKLNLDGGAKITNIKKSEFRDTDIPEGFIITRIDKNKVRTPQDVQRYLANLDDGSGVLIEGTYPDGQKAYFPIGRY